MGHVQDLDVRETQANKNKRLHKNIAAGSIDTKALSNYHDDGWSTDYGKPEPRKKRKVKIRKQINQEIEYYNMAKMANLNAKLDL